MIKALFFDVDGTLVSFKTHRIPESTLEALQQAHANGVKIFTATGRPRQLLDNIPEAEPLMDGYILATGALCLYGNHTVREDLIPRDEAISVVEFCKERGLSAVVVGKKDIQIVNRNEEFENVFRNLLNVKYNKFDVPVEEVIEQGVLQITPFLNEEEEKTVLPRQDLLFRSARTLLLPSTILQASALHARLCAGCLRPRRELCLHSTSVATTTICSS